ncbi:hypothetical protein [Ammoniphilus sp. YIM 78166]|uniref:hypothetical protein n=1 Tax=Ammoniphilus sp. YIM 78166 TaxID=1644106 RepID=UPI0010701868|nr:hypothetical protein [Ammoniphilus sp. YIM 78166]
MKRLLILSQMLLLLLSSGGCSSGDSRIVFEGEGDSWIAQYFIKQDGEEEKSSLVLTYIDEDPADAVGEVRFEVDYPYGEFRGNGTLSDNGVLEEIAVGPTSPIIGGEVVELVVKWKDKEEKIMLNWITNQG